MDTKQICVACTAKCCKSTPPALLGSEALRLIELFGEHVIQWKIGPDGGSPTVAKKEESLDCIFLENDLCIAYDERPLTCRLFPVLPKIIAEEPSMVQLRIWFCPLTEKHEDLLLDSAEAIVRNAPSTQIRELAEGLKRSGALRRKKLRRKVAIDT